MSSFKGFRTGKALPKADVQRRMDAFNKQVEIYDKMSLDELKVEYATGNKGKRLSGVYKLACEYVTNNKLNQARLEVAKEASEEVKNEDTGGMKLTPDDIIDGE